MSLLRDYIRESLEEVLIQEASGGRVLDRLTNQMSRSIIDILKDPQVRKRHAEPRFKKYDDGSKEPIPLNLVLGLNQKSSDNGESQKFSGGMDPELLDNLENVDRIVIRVIAAEPDESGNAWWNVEAAYIYNTEDRSKSVLEVALWLPTNYDFKIFPALIPELKETIRHELEHGTQATEKIEGGKEVLSLKGGESEQFKDPKALADFYTKGGELEAYVTGLYKKAKSLRVPVSDVIDEFLGAIYYRAIDGGMAESDVLGSLSEVRHEWYNYLLTRYPESLRHVQGVVTVDDSESQE